MLNQNDLPEMIRNKILRPLPVRLVFATYSLLFILFFGITAFRSHELNGPTVNEIHDIESRVVNSNSPLNYYHPVGEQVKEVDLQPVDGLTKIPAESLSPDGQQSIIIKTLSLSSSTTFLLRFNGLDGDIIGLQQDAQNSGRLTQSELLSDGCDCGEDDIPPILKLNQEVVIPCDGSISPHSIGIPDAIDDCEEVTLVYQDTDLDFRLSGSGNRVIERTWHAEDGCRNKRSAKQLIYFSDCDPDRTDEHIYSHFDSRFYPSNKRTWRDSGYYFIPELVDFDIRLVRTSPSGAVGMKVTFSGSDVSGLRYNGKALFIIESPLATSLSFEKGSIGSASLLISEELLLCPSPAQEIGLGQNDPFFPLQLSGELLSISGAPLEETIPIRVQLNDFTVR